MTQTGQSLRTLHRDIIVRLAAALGNLRMLAVGAPFTSELTRAAEADVEAALTSAREAERLRSQLERILEPLSSWEEGR